jgi:hypothetical protein
MRLLTIMGMAVLMALNLSAQGRGRGHTSSPPPTMQHNPTATTRSNAPFSADRDKGTDRASDVGKGHKKGLTKHHRH